MKFIKEHIIFSLVVAGIISLTFSDNDSFILNQYLVETEIEESVSEIDELSFVSEVTNSGDGGINGVAIAASSSSLLPYSNSSSSTISYSKEFAKKQPLFILYCCLKIDC